ncbi:hypothetical protein B0H19DRAFT_1375379 [Mycena capillaripes]|nr:hypothetical protein B0H19DRAFT_1375379 [Mycena capillaripes]
MPYTPFLVLIGLVASVFAAFNVGAGEINPVPASNGTITTTTDCKCCNVSDDQRCLGLVNDFSSIFSRAYEVVLESDETGDNLNSTTSPANNKQSDSTPTSNRKSTRRSTGSCIPANIGRLCF